MMLLTYSEHKLKSFCFLMVLLVLECSYFLYSKTNNLENDKMSNQLKTSIYFVFGWHAGKGGMGSCYVVKGVTKPLLISRSKLT